MSLSPIVRTWAVCLMISVLLPGLSGCDRGGAGRPRVARAPGSAVDPDELVGRWKLRYVQSPIELDALLLEITHKDKKFEAKLVGLNEKELAKLKTAEIKEDGQVRLEFDANGLVSSFQGRLDGETIWGTLLMPQFQLAPAKLERTDLEKIDYEQQQQEPERIAAHGDLMNALNAADKFVALNEFNRKRESHRSPLLIEGYAAQANFLKSENFELDKVKEFISEYRKATEVWGSRMAPRVDLEVGRALARQELYPELAKELLAAAEKQITTDYPFDWKLQLAEAWVVVGEHERGLKLLKPLQEIDPTNPQIRMVYARAKEQAKDDAEALKAYAGLAVLPQFEQRMRMPGVSTSVVLPSESAARLWKKQHGDTKGLDEYLKTAYDEQMKLFVPERKPTERDAKGQTVLLELFTGSACQPCVPADIACEALREGFSPQELVVIKYHQHIPLPDPLSNDAMRQRFDFYQAQATPSVFFNGKPVDSVGGPVEQASSMVTRFKRGIEEELKKTAPVDLKVTATRKGDDIEIKASVEGIKTTDNDPRLIFVLLENQISFEAQNGVRVHNCLARAFAGDFLGIKLKPGEVEHTATISLTKVKAEQEAHLKQFEDQAGRQFSSKPLELAHLQLAAIVQNQITKTVFQSAVLDITDAKP